MLTTSKRLLRKYQACGERYKHLCDALGKVGDNEPIPLLRVLELNGLDDALWALRAVPKSQAKERDRLERLFACKCVRRVWHLLSDERSRNAVEVAERYAVGEATDAELSAARDAAWDAACAAWDAAWDAARAAAYAARAARDAACAAWDAAGDAARAARAARAAAWDARDAARDAQAELLREMLDVT